MCSLEEFLGKRKWNSFGFSSKVKNGYTAYVSSFMVGHCTMTPSGGSPPLWTLLSGKRVLCVEDSEDRTPFSFNSDETSHAGELLVLSVPSVLMLVKIFVADAGGS